MRLFADCIKPLELTRNQTTDMTEKITALAVRAVPCPFYTKLRITIIRKIKSNSCYQASIIAFHPSKLCSVKTNRLLYKLSAAILLILNFAIPIKAQTRMKTLSIGDSVPEYFWQLKHHVYHNGKLTVQDLSGYKGKYMILDFWATWCSSCISHFGTLDSLAKANPAKLQIIQVNSIVGTGDTEDKVVSFFKSHVLSMPCIYQDTVLKEMFPRRFLPHYVWINEHGKVDAITSSALINSVNLHSLTASPNTTPNQKEK